MNKTSRTDEPYDGALEGLNQSPHPFSSDLTTNQDLNGIINKRVMNGRGQDISLLESALKGETQFNPDPETGPRSGVGSGLPEICVRQPERRGLEQAICPGPLPMSPPSNSSNGGGDPEASCLSLGLRLKKSVIKFCSFIGPGFMIAVAYSMGLSHFLPQSGGFPERHANFGGHS